MHIIPQPQKQEFYEDEIIIEEEYIMLVDADLVNIGMDELTSLGMEQIKHTCNKVVKGRIYVN